MGITIHYNGKTKSKEDIGKILGYVTFFAKSLNWEVIPVKEKGVGHVERVISADTGKVSYEWLSFSPNRWFERDGVKLTKKALEKMEGEKTEKFGVIINPARPFNTESFGITFYKYKGEYHLRDFCKTQVFGEKEKANLIAHQLLVGVLLTIKNTWLPNLKISDEGDYFIPFTEEDRKKYAEENVSEDYREDFLKKKPFSFDELLQAQIGNYNLIQDVGGLLKKMFPEENIGGAGVGK